MKPLATLLAVALPCATTAALALMHILRIKALLDQVESDPMCLAYIYISFVSYLLHSRLVNFIGNLIDKFCAHIEPEADQSYGLISWIGTVVCVGLEIATLIPFAYRTLALFITAEPTVADALSGRFELAAWILSGLYIALLFISAQYVSSHFIWIRFTVAYAIVLAAPAYIVWNAHHIAESSQVVGKILRSSRAT